MDLAVAISLLTFSAVVIYRVCQRYSHRYPTRAYGMMVASILLSIGLTWTTGYSLQWAILIPHSSVLLFANTPILLLIAAAGLSLGGCNLSWLRKAFVVAALCGTAGIVFGFAFLRPLWHPLQLAESSLWRDGVCLQSHESTCAPAAAATLLRLHGIQADEQTMTRSCLTSCQGTLSLAVFRGISLHAHNARYRPQTMTCEPRQSIARQLDHKLPMLALVDFSEQLLASELAAPETKPWPAILRQLSAVRSLRGIQSGGDGQHAVVLLERLENGDFLVADPAVGKIRWSEDYFRNIWIGEGIYLASR